MRRLLPAPILFLAARGEAGHTHAPELEYYLSADPPSLAPAASTDLQSGEVA